MSLGRIPVNEETLHTRSVIEPGSQVLLADHLAGEAARHLVDTRRKPGRGLHLAARKAAGGQEERAVEGKIMIVIGEAEHRAVAPRHPPAVAGGGGLARKMGGKFLGYAPHGRISVSGMVGMRPASK